MTKTEFVTDLLKSFNDIAEEVPSESARGTYTKKYPLLKDSFLHYYS